MFNDKKLRLLSFVFCSLFVLAMVLTTHGCARQDLRPPIKYFYIDKTGKKVLDGIGYYGDSFKEFAYTGDFSEGFAVVIPFDEHRSSPELKLWGEPSELT